MTFLSAGRLWWLVVLPLLAAAYVLVQMRRKRYVVRFTNLALLSQVAPRMPGWRRHVSAGLLLVALGVMVVAYARPTDAVKVPRERATIMVLIDVSLSMTARDVPPSRFEAAKAAAERFVAELPPRFNVGLVSFAGTAAVLIPPGADRAAVPHALDGLRMDRRTAIGEAVFAGLQAVRTLDAQAGRDPPPAHIVLMSDGDNTTGRTPGVAAGAARAARVPVSTIAFGTAEGTVTLDGQLTPVPPSLPTLRSLADTTGGRAYKAEDAGELSQVYSDIGRSIGFRVEHREVTSRWVLVAMLLTLAAGGASLAWFGRLP